MFKLMFQSVLVGVLMAVFIIFLWGPVDVFDDSISFGDYDWIVTLAFFAGFLGNLVARDPAAERWLEKFFD